MAKNITKGKIGNALTSTANDHVVAVANDIYDENINKYQSQINDELELQVIYDVSVHNNGAVFESLSALLNSSNLNVLIPTLVRHGGMSIRFIQGSEQSSDNNSTKYVQYRLMKNTFSITPADWQGVDNEPTVGSKNLVESGGVTKKLFNNAVIGNNDTVSTTIIEGLTEGRKYKFVIDNPSWDISEVTVEDSYNIIYINAHDIHGTIIGDNLYVCKKRDYPCLKEIIITSPTGTASISFSVRATSGIKVSFYIMDITDVIELRDTVNSKIKTNADSIDSLDFHTNGTIGYSFAIATGEHSSRKDQKLINVPLGTTVSGTISLSDGAEIPTGSQIQVYLYYKDGTYMYNNYTYPVTNGFSCLATKEVAAVGFYIAEVSVAGKFNVVLNQNKAVISQINTSISSLNSSISNLETNKGAFVSLAPSSTPNISLSDRTLTINNSSVIYYNKGSYAIPSGTANDVVVNLASIASGYKKVVFDWSDNTFKVIAYYTALTATQGILLLIRTDYQESGNFTVIYDVVCNFNITIDGVKKYVSSSDVSDSINTVKNGIGEDVSNILDGHFTQVINVATGEHSSVNDLISIIYEPGQTITGRISLGTAEWNGTTLQVYWRDSNKVEIAHKSITMGADFTIFTDNADLKYISFYISSITKAGTLNVEINTRGITDRLFALEKASDSTDIPEYFEENVSATIVNARKDVAEIGLDGENFVFITDMHWEHNKKNSPKLIKRILENMTINNVVFGGDAINGQANQDTAREYFAEISNGLKPLNGNLVSVMGNHDYNSSDGGTAFSNKVFYSLFQKGVDYLATHGNIAYFYFDNPATNTRFIVLETRTQYTLDIVQYSWLDTLLGNTPSDKHIIIFPHVYLREHAQYQDNTFIGYDFSISSDATGSIKTLVDYHVGQGKKIECIVAGHVHFDYNGMTDTLVPVVCTDCDTFSSIMWSSTAGTDTEQSFDVVTVNYTEKVIKCRRVGRGKSRIIHYDSNTLSIGETLDISSLVTIEPTSYSTRDNFSLQYRNAAGGGTGITFNSTLASISDAGVVTTISTGYVVAIAENDDCIETFNIKVN